MSKQLCDTKRLQEQRNWNTVEDEQNEAMKKLNISDIDQSEAKWEDLQKSKNK